MNEPDNSMHAPDESMHDEPPDTPIDGPQNVTGGCGPYIDPNPKCSSPTGLIKGSPVYQRHEDRSRSTPRRRGSQTRSCTFCWATQAGRQSQLSTWWTRLIRRWAWLSRSWRLCSATGGRGAQRGLCSLHLVAISAPPKSGISPGPRSWASGAASWITSNSACNSRHILWSQIGVRIPLGQPSDSCGRCRCGVAH